MCVLGLGLIGGSVVRAATAAGRETFGYNRSTEGVHAARKDGFAATTEITEALRWAADRQALIVLAVPMPAVRVMLAHIKAESERNATIQANLNAKKAKANRLLPHFELTPNDDPQRTLF